jgi:putative FmdB family regulatory protein
VPTYQYACRACGEQLEAVQSFSEASLTECPNCGGELRKVFSAVGVVFKGSGFYKTDSRSSSSSSDKASSSTSDSGSSSSSSDAKSDSKPAAAPAAKSESSSSSSSSSTSSSTSSTPAA